LLESLLNTLVIALAILGLPLGVWYFSPGEPRTLLGPQRQRAVPWTGPELLAVVFLMSIVWPALAGTILGATGLFGIGQNGRPPAPEKALGFQFWAVMLSLPLQLLTAPLFFGLVSGTRLYQLGLTVLRFRRNVLAGIVGWVTFTPCSYLMLGIAAIVMKEVFNAETEQHRLIQELGQNPGGLGLLFTFGMAAIAAPLVEELLFRGVLQPWLLTRRWGGHLAAGLAFLMGFLLRSQHLREAWITLWDERTSAAWLALAYQLTPTYFVVLAATGYLYVWLRFRKDSSPRRAWPTIYATALLFAMMHCNAWPQPVGLFVLAIGLGLAAYRTQSLVPCVVMHGLFNSVAFVLLLVHSAQTEAPEKGSDETSAVRLEPLTSISTAVPGSW
jgi:membrane protease YdiL (CAAX protease family)